jgi:hypothetical protein
MKALSFVLPLLLLLPAASLADSPKVQLDKASKAAMAAKKDLLIIFSGTKWNQASKDFEAKILGDSKFKEGSAKNFQQVLIEIPATRQEAHPELLEFEKTYQFRTIPVVILADSQGRPYSSTGPAKMDAAAFLKHLEELHKIRVERDKDFAAAGKAEGKKKAELMAKALKSLPRESIVNFYEKELVMLEKADPKDETKFAGEIRKAENLKKEQDRYNKLFAARKYEEIVKTARAEGAKMKGEDAQRMKLYEVKAFYAERKYEDALKAVEAMKKMAPKSDLGKRSDQFIAQIKGAIARAERAKEAAKKRAKPVVSKPVAIVTDINQLRNDAKKAQADLAKAIAREETMVSNKGEMAKKIAEAEKMLKQLRDQEKNFNDELKKVSAEREKLARKAKAMKEVVENHEAMEARKREVSELEKRAAELQKQADQLRKKASDIRKGK